MGFRVEVGVFTSRDIFVIVTGGDVVKKGIGLDRLGDLEVGI